MNIHKEQPKEPNYAEADIKAAIDDPIIFQDYIECLNTTSNEGAPGQFDAAANYSQSIVT
jgi:hypothetical protein